jgi:hypothetical protein
MSNDQPTGETVGRRILHLIMGFRFPAVIALLMVLPFMTLEWMTRSDLPGATFSPLWFFIMWLLAAVFVLMLMWIVQTVGAGNIGTANLGFLVLKVAFLGYIAWSWVALVVDQMPCFLGATGC